MVRAGASLKSVVMAAPVALAVAAFSAGPSAAQEPADSAVAEAYRAAVAVGTCGAYRVFEEKHSGTFYGRLAQEYLRKHCTQESRQITAQKAEPVEAKTDAKTPADTTDPATATAARYSGRIGVTARHEDDAAHAHKAADKDAMEGGRIDMAKTKPEPAPATAKPDEGEVKEEPDAGALTASIQEELARLGCSPGRPDGQWGRRTTRAMEQFNEQANADLPTGEPSEQALSALKAKTETVCVAAAPPERPAPAVRATPKKPTKKKVARPAPKKPAPKKRYVKPKRPADRYWGGEDTRIECESGRISSHCFPQR